MSRNPQYAAPDEVLVLLIRETMHGPPQRRLAARFVLDCLKGDHTKEEIAECLDDLHHQALLDVASEARALAVEYHLIA